jgi:(E)-4-hydroxy-3-methylbut-2-enyl-diphosphate synthase
VIADFSKSEKITPASLFAVGYQYSVPLDKWNLGDQACDYIYTGKNAVDFEIPGTLGVIMDADAWVLSRDRDRTYPLFDGMKMAEADKLSPAANFVQVSAEDLLAGTFDAGKLPSNCILVLTTSNQHAMPSLRRAFLELELKSVSLPVIIRRNYPEADEEHLQLYASTDLGGLLLDGFGDGVMIDANGKVSPQKINSLAFGILQAARTRISKTEYISCPSCGRTLFDLQETTAKIRAVTDHLKGLKIGIMGCIVNGPGEMADADYGYVGSGPGKITLYKGREVVKRAIDADLAVGALIDLIRENGDWVEKN